MPWARKPLLIACLSVLGIAAFVLFCQLQFGHWNLYWITQKAGWRIKFDLAALWDISLYLAPPPVLSLPINGNVVSRFSVPFMATFMLGVLLLEIVSWIQGNKTWRRRIGLQLLALALFWITAASTVSIGLQSMVRYSFPPFILLTLGVAHLLSVDTLKKWVRGIVLALFLAYVAYASILLVMLTRLFLKGGWVA
jgi:hypothetical protein